MSGFADTATVLGHAKADVTQIYDERDLAKATTIMRAFPLKSMAVTGSPSKAQRP